MKRSAKLCLAEIMDKVKSAEDLAHLKITLKLNHAKCSYWKRDANEAILQQFDSLEGYLSCVDCHFEEAKEIPIRVKLHDIHVLYVLEASEQISVYTGLNKLIAHQSPSRGRYYDLPPGNYRLRIPAGKTQLFGFYFRSRAFRKKNEEPYRFLYDLIRAHRHKSTVAVCSKDFHIGPRTRRFIHSLCDGLQSGRLKNEGYVFQQVLNLIDLSGEKVSQEETKMSHDLKIAIQARRLLEQYIVDDGQEANLRDLEKDIDLDLDTINRYHKLHFGICLRDLRDSLLVDRAKELLRGGHNATDTAYTLNYNSPDSFTRFFKKNTGQTPTDFIKTISKS